MPPFKKTLLMLLIAGSVGCQQQTPTPEAGDLNEAQQPAAVSTESGPPNEAPATVAIPDDPIAVAAIEKVAVSVKKDAEGFITEVNFRGSDVADDDLPHLTGLQRLQSILLNEATITDAALIPIGKIQSLRNLDLRDCPISNDGLTHLTNLTGLRALRLSGKSGATTIDDAGMDSVGKLIGLKALLLDFLWVSGEGLSQLGKLDGLQELYLAGTLVGDEDLAQVSLFPKLKKLRISKLSQVTGQGLSHVKQLTSLEDLDLSENSSLFDPDMVHLSEMKNLKRLNLWRVAITDAGVEPLAGLTKMEWLNLDNTQLSDVGLKYLKNMDQLTFLHLGSTAITNDGLSELAGLKSLRDLKVTRTAVTEEGVEKLKQELPKTEIQLKYLGDGE